MTDHQKQGLKIVRHINAPKNVVFDAFAKAEALGQWWGPAGSSIVVNDFNFIAGGKFHYKLEGNGQTMWGLFKYIKITPPEGIQFISSFSDEDGNVCTSPFPMDFPLEILNDITLTETNGRTTLTLQGHPVNATAAQQETYNSIAESMQQGFAGTFDKLDHYLDTLNK